MTTITIADRPQGKTLVLFDVDGTLTPARQDVTREILVMLQNLRKVVTIGFVGGSDLVKQQEQLGIGGIDVRTLFDYCFSENGLTAYKLGEALPSTSFIEYLGEDRYFELSKFILHHIADLRLPKKRGTFIEFRNGMINVSPIGRNASIAERHEFEQLDKEKGYRKELVGLLQEKFADYGLIYSIGGQISFDVMPKGWDKTYCLRHVEKEYKDIHFFGDKTFQGGNDYEIFVDERVKGHTVKNPDDTASQVKELFGV